MCPHCGATLGMHPCCIPNVAGALSPPGEEAEGATSQVTLPSGPALLPQPHPHHDPKKPRRAHCWQRRSGAGAGSGAAHWVWFVIAAAAFVMHAPLWAGRADGDVTPSRRKSQGAKGKAKAEQGCTLHVACHHGKSGETPNPAQAGDVSGSNTALGRTPSPAALGTAPPNRADASSATAAGCHCTASPKPPWAGGTMPSPAGLQSSRGSSDAAPHPFVPSHKQRGSYAALRNCLLPIFIGRAVNVSSTTEVFPRPGPETAPKAIKKSSVRAGSAFFPEQGIPNTQEIPRHRKESERGRAAGWVPCQVRKGSVTQREAGTGLGQDGRDGTGRGCFFPPFFELVGQSLGNTPKKERNSPKNAKSTTGNKPEPCPPPSKGRRGGDIRWPPLVPPGAAVPEPAPVMQALPCRHRSSPAASPLRHRHWGKGPLWESWAASCSNKLH